MKQTTKILLISCIVLFVLAGAVTLVGALAKLQHWPGGSSLLTVGMLMQVGSFLFGGAALILYLRRK